MVRMVDPRSESESEESSACTLSYESLHESSHESQLQESLKVWKEDAELSSLEISPFVTSVGLSTRESRLGSSSMESSSGEAIGARPLDSSQMTSGMSVRARDIRLEEELDVDPIPLSSDDRLLRMDKLSVLESPLITESLSRPESESLGSLLVSGCALSSRNNLIDFFRKLGMKSRVRRLESFFILRTSVAERASGSSDFIGLHSSVLKSKVNRLTTQVIQDTTYHVPNPSRNKNHINFFVEFITTNFLLNILRTISKPYKNHPNQGQRNTQDLINAVNSDTLSI